MTTTVARIYPSYGAAIEASNELNGHGFHRDEIDVISKAVNKEDGQATDLSSEISRAGIPSASVPAYAAAIDEGKSLLVVRAAWGAAKKALGVLGKPNGETDPLDADFYSTTFEPPSLNVSQDMSRFPFSAYFKIPLLLDDSTPFSKYWKWPVLVSDSWTFSSLFSWPLLKSGFTFGPPKLISNGAMFSDELNLPVLSKREQEK